MRQHGMGAVLVAVPLVAAALVAGTTARAGQPEGCYRAIVPDTVAANGAAVSGPEELGICWVEEYTPTKALVRVEVDGVASGLYVASARKTEADSEPQGVRFVLGVGRSGRVDLEGVAVANGRTTTIYRLGSPSSSTRQDGVTLAAPAKM